MVSSSEVVEVPGAGVPFSLESILVNMEGGRYIVPILPVSLANLVIGRWSAGGGAPKSSGGESNEGRNKKPLHKVDAMGGPAQVWAHYDAHLPSLSLWDGDKSRSVLEGAVLPTLQSHVLCKNWHFYGV